MAKPIVTTAAASMHSAINWRMRLRGRALIVRTAYQGSSRRSDPGRAAASGWLTTIAGTESEGTARLSAAARGRYSPGAAGELTETAPDASDDTIEGAGDLGVERDRLGPLARQTAATSIQNDSGLAQGPADFRRQAYDASNDAAAAAALLL